MSRSKVLVVLDDLEWFSCTHFQKGLHSTHVTVTHFQNGELSVHFPQNVTGEDIVLLKRFSPDIHGDIFELFQCIDILNRIGAKTITLLLPYYPYARQDHNTNNESKGALVLANILANLGIRKIITLDMHAPEQLRRFPLKVQNLTTEAFWASHLRSLGHNNHAIQIMAADKSAIPRAQQIASALNCSFGYIVKQRNATGEVQVADISGFFPEKRTFLVDDLIDTGRTIIAATQALRKLGSQPITACVTHCHFTETLLSNLTSSGVSQLITTDTITSSKQIQETKPKLLNIFPMLWEEYLKQDRA